MMTRAEYIESLRRLNLKVYFMGELIENPVDHPMIRPSMNSVAKTYELAEKPEYQDLMTVYSPLIASGSTVFAISTKARKIW
jgi:4-hydroxybutyryl-CoA dehydratase/vinylacetyl-CoA-Delta-isomerase